MANIPGSGYYWSELSDELHCYVVISSRNQVRTNLIWRGNIPGIY